MLVEGLLTALGLKAKPEPKPDIGRFYLRIRRAQHKAVELTEKHAPLIFDIGLNSDGVWVQVSCPLGGGSEFYSVRRTVYYTEIEKNPETCPIIEMLGTVADDLSRLLGNRLLPKK